MLSAIKASLIGAINTNDEMSDGKIDKVALRWHKVQEYLKTHDYIMNADVRELCGVSAATANRILASFVAEGNLVKYHEGGHWHIETMTNEVKKALMAVFSFVLLLHIHIVQKKTS